MGKILDWALMPHPPIVLTEVGKGESERVKVTAKSMEVIAEKIVSSGATTVIIVSPHGPMFQDAIALNGDGSLKGDLSRFGASQVKAELENNLDLVFAIEKESAKRAINSVVLTEKIAKSYGVGLELDHGVVVPLSYLIKAGYKGKLVSITVGLLENLQLYEFGRIIQKVIQDSNENVVFLASGDLSHRLTKDAPAGFSPKGEEFDTKIREVMEQGDVTDLWELDEAFLEQAGECGFRPIVMLFGSADGIKLEGKVLSYEGPFGVGYLVAHLKGLGNCPSRYEDLKNLEEGKIEKSRREESLPVKIARETIESYLKFGQIPEVRDIPKELASRGGVFVSLKKAGQLRGCIGTIEATQPNLLTEIQVNAVSASTKDPRFWPLEEDELDKIAYSVDILGPVEPIDSIDSLDVKNYGVIVEKGSRRGLLLPDLPGVESVIDQVNIAKQKAGISEDEEVDLYRFKVTRYI